jgi:hypothetical protein
VRFNISMMAIPEKSLSPLCMGVQVVIVVSNATQPHVGFLTRHLGFRQQIEAKSGVRRAAY